MDCEHRTIPCPQPMALYENMFLVHERIDDDYGSDHEP